MATKQTKLPENSGRVEPVDLRSEMSRSYLDYAMSVIVGRALPDIRDGLKPVHRRVIYAMYDGGYRPDRSFTKCSRIVGDVMGNYHPHGDTAIYDTLVRLAQEWVMRYPLVTGQGNFGSPGNDGAAAMRYTESRMSSLAMEMVRDIDEDTIDFIPNYDGRTQEPTVLPARIPNLLVNGSSGIAVGMATNIPPHNLREVTNAILWALENPKATKEELFANVKQHVKGPDFPTGGLIVGRNGIDEAYKTGRGSITMRAVVEVSEDNKGRQSLVITELPYQVNPDNLKLKIAELVDTGKITGISDLRDDSSSRTGMRIVIVLKKDAVAKVVLNNLYKHTQLEDTFGANMLALVDGVPRTLSIDQFISNWIEHQIQVIQRRTKFRLTEAEKRAHILSALLKALDKLDEVIALIRKSKTVEDAKDGLKKLLKIDDIQATAILDMQLRKLAALERQKITDEYEELMKSIKDYKDILAKPERQRKIISEELSEIAQKYGDDRKTKFVADEGDKSAEDFIKAEDVVVTISRGGYVKRTRSDLYRAQKRGGKGIKGASLREDDVIEHFFVASTHDWLLVFSDRGKVYRTKVHELPDKGRDAKGQHVANLLSFQPEEKIAAVLSIKNYEQAPYLLLATAKGNIKKSPLSEYDSTRSGGIIGINLKPNDRVISAQL
ncbi:MAG: DNA gyrase subunit A, partial [Candidatus Nanopelagicales bacterium]